MDNPLISEHHMAIREKVKISVQITYTVGIQLAPNNNKFRSLCCWLPLAIREIIKDLSPEGSMHTVQNACIMCMRAYTWGFSSEYLITCSPVFLKCFLNTRHGCVRFNSESVFQSLSWQNFCRSSDASIKSTSVLVKQLYFLDTFFTWVKHDILFTISFPLCCDIGQIDTFSKNRINSNPRLVKC